MSEATPQQRKKVLVVSAHPEPRSLNAALSGFAVEYLRAAGHEVRVSDLYAMKWKAAVDADDFPDHVADRRLDVLAAHEQATLAGRMTPDVAQCPPDDDDAPCAGRPTATPRMARLRSLPAGSAGEERRPGRGGCPLTVLFGPEGNSRTSGVVPL